MATNGDKERGDQPAVPADPDKDNKSKKAMDEDLKHFNILFGVTQGVGLLCVVLMLVWTTHHSGGFAWSSNPSLMFNWHPLLMTVGMVYLFANSIMIYRALRTMRKQKLKLIHAGIHSVIVLCIIIGQIAVFENHSLTNKPNLYSLHSWVGLSAVIIFVLQWLLSLLVFLYPGAPMNIRAAVMPWHVLIGLFAFVLAVTAAVMGLLETAIYRIVDYGTLPGQAVLMNSLGMLMVLFAALVVYITTEAKYKRYPRPEDGPLLNPIPNE